MSNLRVPQPGLGLRGSHPPWRKAARKRKGLTPRGSSLAHGGAHKGHRSGSQGRVLREKKKKKKKDRVLALGCGRQKHISLPLLAWEGSLLKHDWGWRLALKLNLLGSRDRRGTIPRTVHNDVLGRGRSHPQSTW